MQEQELWFDLCFTCITPLLEWMYSAICCHVFTARSINKQTFKHSFHCVSIEHSHTRYQSKHRMLVLPRHKHSVFRF